MFTTNVTAIVFSAIAAGHPFWGCRFNASAQNVLADECEMSGRRSAVDVVGKSYWRPQQSSQVLKKLHAQSGVIEVNVCRHGSLYQMHLRSDQPIKNVLAASGSW